MSGNLPNIFFVDAAESRNTDDISKNTSDSEDEFAPRRSSERSASGAQSKEEEEQEEEQEEEEQEEEEEEEEEQEEEEEEKLQEKSVTVQQLQEKNKNLDEEIARLKPVSVCTAPRAL
jgi:hypothetical protein